MKLTTIVRAIALLGAVAPALAQTDASTQRVEITGSSIKRIASEGALPVQIITGEELRRAGIVTAEQLIATLSVNGNGMDNLASNADVGAGTARGSNGLSAANLRGQGAASTLILVNGRRVAAHGLNGGVVDLNSIPMAAIERIEILKDGASAIYGTDAIGGVINFILRKNMQGLEARAFADITEAGGANITRVQLTGGFGDLDKDRFNVMVGLNRMEAKALRGDQRDFVNTFQPNRGLSVDTRGTPFATVFPITTVNNGLARDNINNTGRGTGPIQPGTTLAMSGGINVLDLPGGAGCNSIPGMDAYNEVLWATPNAKWACAWDTGRAAVLQQPLTNTNLVARGALRLGEHQLFAEFLGSKSEAAKTFSANQISSSTNTTSFFRDLLYPSTGAGYNFVFNELVKTFPTLEANRGAGLAFRWRCIECGSRQIDSEADTRRLVLGADGPLAFGWDYRIGFSKATSDGSSLLGNGYFFGAPFADLLRTGVLNPFLQPGQTQTAAALTALAATSANGTTLYGGKYTLTQADAMVTGPLFKLPAGDVMAAVGLDSRKERYGFNGNATDLATQQRIFNAPFDSVNTLDTKQRDIRAVFAEVLVPISKRLEFTVAGRQDDYTGFGKTTNPKVSLRFTPIDSLLTRASYSTGFRVPTFPQLFFGVTESPTSGATIVDPAKCPTLLVDVTKPGCESINPNTLFGGKPDLGPEKSKQWTGGFVWAPRNDFSLGADWWSIRKEGTIQSLSLTTLIANYALFPQNFIRNAAGTLTHIDIRWVNAGETITKGIDLNARANGTIFNGKWSALLEGTYLLDKKSRVLASAPFGPSEIGAFTRTGDIGLRWKHSVTGTYTQGPWTGTLTQLYRSGYKDAVLPGVANGSVVPPDWAPNVSSYTVFNASIGYGGIKNLGLIFGIKNVFDKDPPFSAAYDTNTGAGSSWEPRVADPRGRAFTFTVDYKFF